MLTAKSILLAVNYVIEKSNKWKPHNSNQTLNFRMFVSLENALLWMTSKKREKLPPWPKRFARQLADSFFLNAK